VPDDADEELRRRAQEFLDVLTPMQREQIDVLRDSGANITIVELAGTTHMLSWLTSSARSCRP
jgi:hypothetical protein